MEFSVAAAIGSVSLFADSIDFLEDASLNLLIPLTLAGLGALAINLVCAFILLHHRHGGGSLTRAAFLAARNDVFANIAIVGTGMATAYTLSIWPDLVVGICIAAMNADSAREVWRTARKEIDVTAPIP